MNRKEFMNRLDSALSDYKDKNKCIAFYNEIISDRIREGENEEDIIESFGSIDEIVLKLTGKKEKPKRFNYTERFDSKHDDSFDFSDNKESKSFEKPRFERKERHHEIHEGNDNINVVKLIVIIVLAFMFVPVIFGSIGTVFGLLCGLIGSCFGGLFGFFGSLISNIVTFSGASSVANIGLAIMFIGLSLVGIYFGIKLFGLFIKLICYACKALARLFSKGGWLYE